MIEGVRIKRLTRHLDDRGYLVEILRDDDAEFIRFGQVYVSTCHPGVVKAWHAHRLQTDHLFVARGIAKVGLYDDREQSSTRGETQGVILSELEPMLLQVPPLVWHGYTALANDIAYLINIPTHHYNREEPDELRRDPADPAINFHWSARSR